MDGENNFASVPVALYGGVLLMAGFAYSILVQFLIRLYGRDSVIAQAVGRDTKGYLSLVLYLVAIPLASFSPIASCVIYLLVALIWFIPDSRIEKMFRQQN